MVGFAKVCLGHIQVSNKNKQTVKKIKFGRNIKKLICRLDIRDMG